MKKTILMLAVTLISTGAHAACNPDVMRELKQEQLFVSGQLLEAAQNKNSKAVQRYTAQSIQLMKKMKCQ